MTASTVLSYVSTTVASPAQPSLVVRWSSSCSPWQVGRHAPIPGEHNIEVYQRLGLSGGEIETLARDGVI